MTDPREIASQAALLVSALDQCIRQGDYESADRVAVDTLTALVAAETERCAKVICNGCRSGFPIVDAKWHRGRLIAGKYMDDPNGVLMQCKASAIRATP